MNGFIPREYTRISIYHFETGTRVVTLVCKNCMATHPDVLNHLDYLVTVYQGWVVYLTNIDADELTGADKDVIQLRFGDQSNVA